MAHTATIYSFETELADIDRGVYETLGLRLARQPSETLEYMLTRFLAYCLEYTEGIAFTEGVAAGDQPAVLVRDLTGRVHVLGGGRHAGCPAIAPRQQARGPSGGVHARNIAQVLAETGRQAYSSGRGDSPCMRSAEALWKKSRRPSSGALTPPCPIIERQLYLDMSGQTFSTAVVEHHFT